MKIDKKNSELQNWNFNNNFKIKKLLKFDTNIKIKSYQYYSFPIGIISANTDYCNEILINKFTNIFMGENLQYYENEYFSWENFIVKKIRANKENLIDILIKYICNDYYINININEFFIKSRKAYKLKNVIHDCLIIGYDLNNKYLILVGNDKNGMLNKEFVDFNLFIKATNFIDENVDLTLIKLKKNFKEITNKEKLIKDLTEYFFAIEPRKRISFEDYNTFKFGIDAYKKFIEYYKDKSEFLINDIYFIYEQKYIFSKKLLFLFEQGIIPEKVIEYYKIILKKSEQIKNLYIKFFITKQKKYIEKIKIKLNELLIIEIRISKILSNN
ncbi:hypothetical protein WHY64_16005 (plasmid) [Clostridium perfringens]|uniref:hypothetical protein n=1 Tax=Clostridium perfringens TaxID=1502 RepID=UPI0030D18833